MLKKISQSFIKDAREYFSGNECGNIMRERWVNDKLIDNEEPGAMELGAYFEFILFGAIPKNNKPPVPQYMASKVKANKGSTRGLGIADMYDEYRKAHVNAETVKKYMNEMGLKVVHVGRKLTKGRYEGVIDLEVEVTIEREFLLVFDGEDRVLQWNVGDHFVIDLKYSGLVGDTTPKWNKHGWSWSEVQKEYHGTQAKQYHYISNLPFYFLVTQSNNKADEAPIVKLFHVPVDEYMINAHLTEGNMLHEKFLNSVEFGLVPKPSLNKCSNCPLRDDCTDKHTFPHPEIVDLTKYI